VMDGDDNGRADDITCDGRRRQRAR
jgi:hypothetical protein